MQTQVSQGTAKNEMTFYKWQTVISDMLKYFKHVADDANLIDIPEEFRGWCGQDIDWYSQLNRLIYKNLIQSDLIQLVGLLINTTCKNTKVANSYVSYHSSDKMLRYIKALRTQAPTVMLVPIFSHSDDGQEVYVRSTPVVGHWGCLAVNMERPDSTHVLFDSLHRGGLLDNHIHKSDLLDVIQKTYSDHSGEAWSAPVFKADVIQQDDSVSCGHHCLLFMLYVAMRLELGEPSQDSLAQFKAMHQALPLSADFRAELAVVLLNFLGNIGRKYGIKYPSLRIGNRIDELIQGIYAAKVFCLLLLLLLLLLTLIDSCCRRRLQICPSWHQVRSLLRY